MATNNAINLSAAGIPNYDGAGIFNAITVTQYAPIVGGASNSLTSISPLQDGELLIGVTGGDPVGATLTAGSGITITEGAGTITIAASGGGGGAGGVSAWVDVTGTSQAMSVNTGYRANNASLVTLTLPATAAQFTVIRVAGSGAGGWRIAQNAGQNIQVGNQVSTTGVTGSVSSTNRYDTLELICTVADTTWQALSGWGNLTVA